MTHATLVQLGVRWLSRKSSVVLYEAAAAKAEIPDVIGWSGSSSILIECKSSRADFLRDAGKKSRTTKLGMAQRRYYLCPSGMIAADEVPAKWGLLWASKNTVTVEREAKGFAKRNYLAEIQFLSAMLRRAQIRIGTRPLSEWLRGENRFEAVRGVSPNRQRVMTAAK